MNNTLLETKSFGYDCGAGNVLALQPWMEPEDYRDTQAFRDKLSSYIEIAQSHHWLTSKTVVLFPEHIATWLIAADEDPRVFEADTTGKAFGPIARRNWRKFLKGLLTAKATDRKTAALFIAKSSAMAEAYTEVFATLAKKFRVSIIAGSTVLPNPQVSDGKVKPGRGPLQNISAFFHADGSLDPKLVRKIYPVEMELPFISAAELSSLPVYSTSLGRLGVLICADSWYPQTYDRLDRLAAEVILVPSHLTPTGAWQQPWRGYNGAPPPGGVDPRDTSRLSEAEAWEKYAVPGRLPATTAKVGVNVFLRGNLWDLGSDGHTLARIGDQILRGDHIQGAALHNFWLPLS